MENFEYARITSSISDEEFNDLGEKGWEYIEETDEGFYIFKRKKDLIEGKQMLHD